MLERQKPFPLPMVNPVPEYRATSQLKNIYEETKTSLQVPWMGVVTMAFAHYPTFFDTLWRGIEKLVGSEEFVKSCFDLRNLTESQVLILSPTSLNSSLIQMGYDQEEIREIIKLNEVFSHGNMPYLMIATAARLLLEGYELSDATNIERYKGKHGPSHTKPLVLMEAHHASPSTLALYEDIKSKLGLPIINTDYRAFARWPTYFGMAWDDLSHKLVSAKYEQQVCNVHDFAVGQMLRLPNPSGLTCKILQESAQADASLHEIKEVVRLFQWLLPGLALNVAYLRAQLLKI